MCNQNYGPSCSVLEKPTTDQCGFCMNNAKQNDWGKNHFTGCNCKNTGYWGWHCELDNKILCKYVNRGSMKKRVLFVDSVQMITGKKDTILS